MENSYGIGVTNRYELFYDEDVDPMDLISQSVATEKENKAKGGVKAAKGPAGKKAGKTEVNNKIAEKTDNFDFPTGNAGRGRGGDNRVKFSDREERNNRRNRPEGEFRQPGEFRQSGDFKQGGEFRDGDRPAPRFDGERGRGRGRGGMGRGRGRGRGAGPDGRGKREFDRQSGMVTSGVKAVDKRDGSGSYNWGSDKELVEENLNAEVSDHDTSAENAEKIEEGAPTEGEEPKTEEETAREMTLDEYKAMQKASKNNKPAFNIRKAGEGENQAQWKKTYVLKKKVEEEVDEDEDDEDYEAHHGRRKVVLDIDFQFSDSPARGRGRGRGRGGDRGRGRGDRGGFERRGGMGDRGGRGGRGSGDEGGRGMDTERGRGRGGPRGGRGGRQEAPKMDDERDFPSLG